MFCPRLIGHNLSLGLRKWEGWSRSRYKWGRTHYWISTVNCSTNWRSGYLRSCGLNRSGWKGDVILLVSDSDVDEVTFLRHGGMGNLKGVTPTISLCSLVNTSICCNKEVTLYLDTSGLSGFSVEMDICSNLCIKE